MRIVARHNVNWGRSEAKATLEGMLRWHPEAVQALETHFAAFHAAAPDTPLEAIAFSSGRAALYVALQGLGIGPGCRVGVPAYTFYTLPAVVEALGAEPLFLPCDRRTYALDPEQVIPRLEGLSALLVLHPFGQSAPLEPLLHACAIRNIPVIEDPSQSIGARYQGQRLGTLGEAAAFSLVSGKNMTTGGGGILLTRTRALAQKARVQREALPVQAGGLQRLRETWQECLLTSRLGYRGVTFPAFWLLNLVSREWLDQLFEEQPMPLEPATALRRLDERQAALGKTQLERLDALNVRRRQNAEQLLSLLAEVPGLELPQVVPGTEPTFNAVAVRVLPAVAGVSAQTLRRRLLLRGVDTREDYMRWFGEGPPRKDEVLYLPNHPGMSAAAVQWVAEALRRSLAPHG